MVCQILFIFSKNQLLVLLIFAAVSFISFSFISALTFMISFLLLTFGIFLCWFRILAVQIQVETRKQSIIWEFEKYRRLLKKKQPPGRRLEVEAAAALASLEQEEGETMQKLELNHEALIQQSRVLWRMIAELEERSQRPVHWMLQVRSRFSWDVWARPEGSLAFWERGLPSLQ